MLDEQVFCESCGKERVLVPVFDAKIEAQVSLTMSEIAEDLANTKEIIPTDVKQAIEEREKQEVLEEIEKIEQEAAAFEEGKQNTETKPKMNLVAAMLGGIFAVVILVLVVLFISIGHNNSSYEYQIAQAEKYYEMEDFEQMLVCAKKACKIATNSSDAKMLLARAYYGLGDTANEEKTLRALILADEAYTPAYDLYISILEEKEEYEEIGKWLVACPQQSVRDKYADYLTDQVHFSEESGIFDFPVSVKLIASGKGDILYTLDGSDPIANGNVYLTPISVTEGTVEIKAVYKNIYGIFSEVSEAKYTVLESSFTMAPQVMPPSGSFNSPQYITIENLDEFDAVYYTTDGSEPTLDSNVYNGPIVVPFGKSEFQFIAVDVNQNQSEPISCQYQFNMDLALTQEQAENMLTQALIQGGIILDAAGNLPNQSGVRHYKVYSVIDEGNELYYLLDEKNVDSAGNESNSGNSYAVCIRTGESFLAIKTALGFHLNKIQ